MFDSPPQTPQQLFRAKVRKYTFALACGGLSVGFALAQQKGLLDWIPNPLVVLLIVIPLLYFIYHLWTHEGVKKRRHLVYTYPVVSLIVLMLTGALIGGGVGFVAWWTTFRQPESSTSPAQTSTPQPFTTPEAKTEKTKIPTILTIEYQTRGTYGKTGTVVLLVARIINSGSPTVVRNYQLSIRIPGRPEMRMMPSRALNTLTGVGADGSRSAYRIEDDLNVKTAEQPIPTGGGANGYLLFIFDNLSPAELNNAAMALFYEDINQQYKVDFTFEPGSLSAPLVVPGVDVKPLPPKKPPAKKKRKS